MEFPLESTFDAFRLASKDEYSIYFNLVLHHLANLSAERKQIGLTDQEAELANQYIKYLSQTLCAMRLRYLYDPGHSVKLDVHESGFPAYSELRNLYNELLVKDDLLSKALSVPEIKKKIVDYICQEKKNPPDEMMHNLALQYYLQTTKPQEIFYKGIKSIILKAESPEVKSNSFLISWASYDSVLNRPLLNYMYFDYTGTNLEEDVKAIHTAINNNGVYLRELVLVASMIDKELAHIHPKLIKRIDVGPFHSVFSHDNNPLSLAIRKGVDDRILEVQTGCLQVSIDTVRSIGENKVKSGGIIWGKDHQVFQQYLVPATNKRGASESKTYILGSHSLLQYLSHEKVSTGNYIVTQEITIDNTKKQL